MFDLFCSLHGWLSLYPNPFFIFPHFPFLYNFIQSKYSSLSYGIVLVRGIFFIIYMLLIPILISMVMVNILRKIVLVIASYITDANRHIYNLISIWSQGQEHSEAKTCFYWSSELFWCKSAWFHFQLAFPLLSVWYEKTRLNLLGQMYESHTKPRLKNIVISTEITIEITKENFKIHSPFTMCVCKLYCT